MRGKPGALVAFLRAFVVRIVAARDIHDLRCGQGVDVLGDVSVFLVAPYGQVATEIL